MFSRTNLGRRPRKPTVGSKPGETTLGDEPLESRTLLAADALAAGARMTMGMNLENVVDWSPAWTFTNAFKASRPWISHAFNPQTWGTTWDPAAAPPLDVDGDGNVKSLKTWMHNGITMRQWAGTLMFDALGGNYAGGTYRAEWDGTGTVTFGFDAVVTASGRTSTGRSYADLRVTPTDSGIYMRIEATSPSDPVRNFDVWMPDWNGRSFVGQRWQPGAPFSPFHPLFLERLAPFKMLRFMAMQETNTSDIRSWADRRDASDIRQGSGAEGTPSEPVANGMSLEYMVELANELDADPWFNMPHQADDAFVRNFATYVRDHLEPGRTVSVEWANEVWNFGLGFEASAWVARQAAAERLDPDYGQWIVTAREANRDFNIWSDVFAGQSHRLVRVAAGQAANPWIVEQIAIRLEGGFDAIALAPYITFTDEQRAGYSSSTTVDRVLADARTNVSTALQWTREHADLVRRLSTQLGRPIKLVAYEAGPHLDGRGAPYQAAFVAATNDPRMGDIYREYLVGLDAAGLDACLDFQFTGHAGATPWGDFAKLHRMDEPLETAWKYAAVRAAADGSLWGTAPPPPALPVVSIAAAAAGEGNFGSRWMTFAVTLSAAVPGPVTVRWATENGTALAGSDYRRGAGTVAFAPGQTTAKLRVAILGDRRREGDETLHVVLSPPAGATLSPTGGSATGTILDDDTPRFRAAAFAALASQSSGTKKRAR